ncbi:hypothetical protein L7F22_024204 [Adiantum nelumboides]|nr:hypothetical protein [Adiantum nelumboides]
MPLLSPEKHDDLSASDYRKLSVGSPFQRPPRVLSKQAPAADLPTPKGELRFRWLTAGLVAGIAAFDDTASHVYSDREPAIGLAMVFVEAASTRPPHKSLKGWESIKLGMDYVLGRSIVPETRHRLSHASHSAGKDVSSSSRNTISLQRYSLTSKNGLDPPLTCKETNCHPQIQHSHLASAEESKAIPKQFFFFERNAVAGAVSGMCVSRKRCLWTL